MKTSNIVAFVIQEHESNNNYWYYKIILLFFFIQQHRVCLGLAVYVFYYQDQNYIAFIYTNPIFTETSECVQYTEY